MTKSIAAQAVSFVLAALATLGTLAGVNGIAMHQFTAADTQVMMTQGETTDRVAAQSVVIVGHRVAKA
jgi:hypothetical protein